MNLSNIAESIRKIRQQQNLTVEQLAVKAGFTKGYISRLENFRVTPSLSALKKISDVIGVPLSAFFEDDFKSPQYIRSTLGSGEEIIRNDAPEYGMRYYSLAFRKIDRIIDPFILEYSPSDKIREMMMHDSDEFFVVLEGEIDYIAGDAGNRMRLRQNDTIYLSANIPHSSTLSPECTHAKALIIYCQNSGKIPARDQD